MNMNGGVPTWEPITLSDTVPVNYYGVMCLTAGNLLFKSESAGSTMTLAMTAGQYAPGRVVLTLATGSTGTYAGAKAI